MGRGPGNPQARVSVGVRADRQLRIADRAGRRVVAADARRWARAPVFHWSRAARQGGSLQGAGALTRAPGTTRTLRAGGICAERGLHLWGHATSRPAHFALRRLGHFFELRDDSYPGADEYSRGLSGCV